MAHAIVITDSFYPNVQARESAIPNAGLGLFASEDFQSGAFLGEYIGKRLTKNQKDQLYDKSNLFKVSDDLFLDPSDDTMLMRYINHCFDQEKRNVEFKVDDGRVYVFTTREITAGEEFYVSYGHSYWLSANTEEIPDMTPEPATSSAFYLVVNGNVLSEIPCNILNILKKCGLKIHNEDAYLRFNSIVGYMLNEDVEEIGEWDSLSLWECRNDKDHLDLASFLCMPPRQRVVQGPKALGVLGEDFSGLFDTDDIEKIAEILPTAF